MSVYEKIVKLVKEKPIYGEILKRAVEIERNPPNDFVRDYGWEWHHVQAMPPYLVKLVSEGILQITYKSRKYTHYKLVDLEETERALKDLGIL